MTFFYCLATSYSHRGKPPTTIGAEELNFRVRYGNGCDLFAIITRPFCLTLIRHIDYYIMFFYKVNRNFYIPSKLDNNLCVMCDIQLQFAAPSGQKH